MGPVTNAATGGPIGGRQHPIYFIALMLLVPMWFSLHFYATHRLIKWGHCINLIHKANHRNVNPGPISTRSSFSASPDEPARVNALLSGEVHAVTISPHSAKPVQAAPSETLLEPKSRSRHPARSPRRARARTSCWQLSTCSTASKFSEPFTGFGVIANDQPVDPTIPLFDPSLPQRPFDLIKRASI